MQLFLSKKDVSLVWLQLIILWQVVLTKGTAKTSLSHNKSSYLGKKKSPHYELTQDVVWYSFYTPDFIHSSCLMETGKIKTFVQYPFLREPLS